MKLTREAVERALQALDCPMPQWVGARCLIMGFPSTQEEV